MAIGDKQYLVIEQKLDFGWGLRYFVPSSALLEGRDSLLVGLLTLLLLLTALLMGLSVLLSRVLIGRVELLSHKVNAVVSTGAIEELHVPERDEIGVLSNSVAQMIEESQRMTRLMYESKIALREAEIELLQMQIKPHFLYNTLSLINWRAIKSGDHEISQIALMLTQFYRTMLNNGRNVTLVSDEWMTVEAYLHIQLLFHNRNFDADMRLDERISSCHMPNLLLQPLVENAIEHGLDMLRGVRGKLRVTGSKNGQMLRFEIEDNGPGFSRESLRTARTQCSENYGLKNIDERLRLLYGDSYILSFTNLPEGGALVVLEIPPENFCFSSDARI
jgi:two-component system sensor histidine kinase YesM